MGARSGRGFRLPTPDGAPALHVAGPAVTPDRGRTDVRPNRPTAGVGHAGASVTHIRVDAATFDR